MESHATGESVRRTVAALLSIIAGLVAAATIDASPTGDSRVDLVLVAVFAGALAATAQRANPIAIVPALLIGLGATGSIGVAAFAIAVLCIVGSWYVSPEAGFGRRPPVPTILFGVGIIALTQALFRVRDFGYERLSAVAVGLAVAVVLAAGWLRGSRRTRIWSAAIASCCLLIALVIGVATAFETSRYRFDVEVAADHSADAADAFAAGDMDRAQASLHRAQTGLVELRSDLDGGWTRVARTLPLFGPNLRAIEQSTDAAIGMVDAGLIIAAGENPLDIVRRGRIDVDRADQLRVALVAATDSVERSQSHLQTIDTVWLAPPLSRQVKEFTTGIASLRAAMDATVGGLAQLSTLGGYEEPRTYMFLIGNPAEARDLGGFAAGYALVSARDGRFELLQAGRAGDLKQHPGDPGDLQGSYPQRFLELEPWRYGQNLTAVTDLPTVARAVADLFPQMAGVDVDGVVYLDPYALEALIALSGPVRVPEFGIELNGSNTADFFITDQYERFPRKADRNAILEAFVAGFVDQIGAVDATRMRAAQLRRLADVVEQQRLAIATTDPAELAVLEEMGLSGAVQAIEPGQDVLAVSHVNGGPNKLDAYLERSITYDAVVDAATGELDGTVTVQLTNTVPAGRSGYEINNTHGVAPGVNRAVLVVHTPHEAVRWEGAEPEPALTRSFWEFDRWRHERVVLIPPGESVTVSLHLSGLTWSGDDYELVVGHQPLVTTDHLEIHVESGSHEARYSGPLESDLIVHS